MKKLRITYNAPVVLTFAVIAVIVLLLPVSIERWFVAYPSFRYGAHSYVGLFTHIFGHANWQHLLGNFMLILLIGPILEERHGSMSLLVMIAITALVEGLVNVGLSSHPMLGASGTAFMMIILASMANIRAGEIPLTFLAVAGIYLGSEIYAMANDTDSVSHLTHLVGGFAGAAFGFIGAGAPRATAPVAKPVLPAMAGARAPAQTKKSGIS